MIEPKVDEQPRIASAEEERITRLGLVLRKLKLDELPQLIHVLRGEMSLVGPRPKIPSQQTGMLLCKPGITGAATLAFAREDILLARIPEQSRLSYYDEKILPAKHRLDSEHMAQATMFSDLRILLLTALGRWQDPASAMKSQV
jgi:lipopolysaccharide/colanic/teichoic acid biosynthesis glycosyltransferase